MHLTQSCMLLTTLAGLSTAEQWPYDRYHGTTSKKGNFVPKKSRPEFQDDVAKNEWGHWFHRMVNQKNVGSLQGLFVNGSIPDFAGFGDILDNLDVPQPPSTNKTTLPPHTPSPWPAQDVNALLGHLPFDLDPKCTKDKKSWWYRTYDGSCNWIKNGEILEGAYGQPRSRDYGQHYYADGVSKPREGPNARAVSNAFFKRKETLYYEHTPLILGLAEFIMHDITSSQDSTTEYIDVAMPEGEEHFTQNTTMRVWRTEAAPGTGTSKENPRENMNSATTWLDLSSLYGSSEEVADKLRTFKKGKLLTQEAKTRGAKKAASYLPFNKMGVPTRTRPGVDPSKLFAGGDPRTNEDWVMLGVHTLLLREHNRLCDILASKHPEYNDEELYQTVRLLLSAKFQLIGNAYQMAYFKDMPWPNDDGFPLYREMSGDNWLETNPANNYPWPVATKNGKPTVASAEMAVVYRFHEFIINNFPIKDALNETIWDQNLFSTAFNSTGFVDAGLEGILRGTVSTTIPNFKSGVDEDFRSAGRYRGSPFDIVVWSIIHEREQGLPTFNNYFRAYNKEGPEVLVPIPEKFEDFSSDPKMVSELKRLYKTPDDVDLVVGCQLDETWFPHATVPTSALIVSIFNLVSVGNSDRFSIGFAAMRCLLVDQPWDCHPSNALEELLWKPQPKDGYPNFRFYDDFWMTELDFQAHGQNLLWRLVTENSEIDCLQKNPLFPVDEDSNPILCSLPKAVFDVNTLVLSASTGVQVVLSLLRAHWLRLLSGLVLAGVTLLMFTKIENGRRGYPKALKGGLPFLGRALDFQKDAKSVITEGFAKYGTSASKTFGIHLAGLTHYVISKPADIQQMIEDGPYELRFNLSKLLEAVNVPIILGKENFATDLHTKLVRENLGKPDVVREIGKTVEYAARRFLDENPLVPDGDRRKEYKELSSYMSRFIAAVSIASMVGEDAWDHPELIDQFIKFTTDVDMVMGLGSMLPSFLRWVTKIPISISYHKFRKVFRPIIEKRRADYAAGQNGRRDFMPYIMDAVYDDRRASDLVAITVWFGLRNLQVTLTSTILDIVNVSDMDGEILGSLNGANVDNLNTFGPAASKNTPWAKLRSAVFESIRLSGSATGPARIVSANNDVPLRSDPSVHIPKGQVATLSSFWSHRDTDNWGPNAVEYKPGRFLEQDPDVGSPQFIAWGFKSPHLCPGRWFAQEAICIMTKAVLEQYKFEPERYNLGDDEKYSYSAGVVTRKEVPVTVSRRG